MSASAERLTRNFEARRRYVRVAQIGRTIKVMIDGNATPFTLTNISSRGAAGSCATILEPGNFYTFVFENGASYRGEIRWLREELAGIFFASTLPIEVLTPPALMRALQSRAPRYSVSRPGTLTVRGAPRPCIVHNVSVSGMMLETTMPPQPGQIVHFTYGGFRAEGEVRWSRQGFAGIRFLEPIDLGDFEEKGTSATGTFDAPAMPDAQPC